MGVGLLIGLREDPPEKRFDAIAGGHRIAGTGDVGFQFVGRIGGRVSAELFNEVSEFVAEDEGPGVRRDFLRGDGVNGDGAILQAAADRGQGAFFAADDQPPVDLAAGGLGDFTGDRLELGKARRRPIARIRAAILRPAERGWRRLWLGGCLELASFPRVPLGDG